MDQGHLPSAGTALILAFALAAAASAQGPIYRERWAYLHLETRRAQVRQELAGRDRDAWNEVAGLLVAEDRGIPFGPVATALARLRKVPCDEAFALRTMMSAFVLPEVVDPEATNEDCRTGNVSLFLPYTIPLPGKITFRVDVVDGAGSSVFEGAIERDTDIENLRMGRAHVRVPAAGLPDGSYRVRIRTLLDGVGPRATDPGLEHSFAVLRGYQKRAEAAMAAVRHRDASLPVLPRALLRGMSAEVARAFAGEAFDVRSTAVPDLLAVERALKNLEEERPVPAGAEGCLVAALPAGEGQLGACIRWPQPGDRTQRPLVVFAAGAPSYDAQLRRPASPATRGARWLFDEVAAFDREGRFHVACLESPGNGVDYGRALEQAVAALRELLPVAPAATVVVAEREAAVAATFHQAWLVREVQGLVLVGAGALGLPQLQRLAKVPMLACGVHGHPSGDGLRRLADLVATKRGEPDWAVSFEFLSGDDVPWMFATSRRLDAIEAFARRVTAAR